MRKTTVKHVNFKLKSEDLTEKLESLAFYYSKSQQEILEEALILYWEKCVSVDKNLEIAKKLKEER